jgi:hypothetical protein
MRISTYNLMKMKQKEILPLEKNTTWFWLKILVPEKTFSQKDFKIDPS